MNHGPSYGRARHGPRHLRGRPRCPWRAVNGCDGPQGLCSHSWQSGTLITPMTIAQRPPAAHRLAQQPHSDRATHTTHHHAQCHPSLSRIFAGIRPAARQAPRKVQQGSSTCSSPMTLVVFWQRHQGGHQVGRDGLVLQCFLRQGAQHPLP